MTKAMEMQQPIENTEEEEPSRCARMGNGNDEERAAKKTKAITILRQEDGTYPASIHDVIDEYVTFELAWLNKVYTEFRGDFDDWLATKGFKTEAIRGEQNNDDRLANKQKLVWILLNENGELYNPCCIDGFLRDFLGVLKKTAHNILTQVREYEDDPHNDRAFTKVRDTKKQIENIVRLFPENLSKRKEPLWMDEFEEQDESIGMYPIQIQTIHGYRDRRSGRRCTGPGAAKFIPLLARLAIEFGQFEDGLRGGLLLEDKNKQNVLQRLASTRKVKEFKSSQYECIDAKYTKVLTKLRSSRLLHKEDIAKYNLLRRVCKSNHHFSEKRFAFLSDWDPERLVHTDWPRVTPLHIVATTGSDRAFRMVFEAGIRHFPSKEGILVLFQKDWWGKTPFASAKKQQGDSVSFIKEIMAKYSDKSRNLSDLMLSAVLNNSISLDGVYFLLRRQPDMLKKMLSVAVVEGDESKYESINEESKRAARAGTCGYNAKGTERCRTHGKVKQSSRKKRKKSHGEMLGL